MECSAWKRLRSCFVLLIIISIITVIILLFLPGNDNIFAAKRDGDTFCSAIRDRGATIKISNPKEEEAGCLIISCT
jgi:hypothetical protein